MRDVPLPVLVNSTATNDSHTNVENLGLIAVNCAFAGVIIIASILRFYTTAFVRRRVTSDDLYLLLAVVVALGYNASVILANVKFYWYAVLVAHEVLVLNKIAFATKLLYLTATFLVRTSLLCLYYRVQRKLGLPRYTWILHAATVYSTVVFLAFIPLFIFQCTPVSAYWRASGSGKCLDEGPITVAAAVCTCAAELLITALAAPLIIRSKLPLWPRLLAVVLLVLGIICTAAGIIRTYFIWKSLLESTPNLHTPFPRWICEAIEIGVAVLCVSMTALHPLIDASQRHRDFETGLSGSAEGFFGASFRRASFGGALPGSGGLRASSAGKSSIDYESHIYRPEFQRAPANTSVETKTDASGADGANAPWVPPQYQPNKSARNSTTSSTTVKKLYSLSRSLRRAKSRTAAPLPQTTAQPASADPHRKSSLPRLRALTPLSPLRSSFIDTTAAESASRLAPTESPSTPAPLDSPTISLDRFLPSPPLHQASFRPRADHHGDMDDHAALESDLTFPQDWPLAAPVGPGPARPEPRTLGTVSSARPALHPGAARVKSKVAVRACSDPEPRPPIPEPCK